MVTQTFDANDCAGMDEYMKTMARDGYVFVQAVGVDNNNIVIFMKETN